MTDNDLARHAHGLLPIDCERPLTADERLELFGAVKAGVRQSGDIAVRNADGLLLAYLEPYCCHGWLLYKDMMGRT